MDSKLLRFYGQLSGALMAKFIFVLGAAYLGFKLDRAYQTYPWCSVGFVLVAGSLGIAFVIRTANRLDAERKQESEK